MKRVTFRFAGGDFVTFHMSDEKASALYGELGSAWNGSGGAMYTCMFGGDTHMINLNLVIAVEVR